MDYLDEDKEILLTVKTGIFSKLTRIGFRFDLYAFKLYAVMSDGDPDQMNFFSNPDSLMLLYHCAHISYRKKIGKNTSMTLQKIKKMHDLMPQKSGQQLFNTLLSSQIGGESVADSFNKMIEKVSSDVEQDSENSGLKKKSTS